MTAVQMDIMNNLNTGLQTSVRTNVRTGLAVNLSELEHQNLFYYNWSLSGAGHNKLYSPLLAVVHAQTLQAQYKQVLINNQFCVLSNATFLA